MGDNIIELFNKLSKTSALFDNKGYLKKGIYSFINPYSYFWLRKNPNIISRFNNFFADGFFLVFLYNLFFFKHRINRCSFDMSSLGDNIFKYACIQNNKIFLIGSKENEIQATIRILVDKYKSLNICGYRNGYFSCEKEKDETIRNIITLNPDIIIVGMGTPMQEEFLIEVKKNGWDGIGFTCGGFLHQTSKRINYYPYWINKLCLRWIYRLIYEQHTRKRFFKTYPIFPFVFIFDVVKYRFHRLRLTFGKYDH